MRPSKPAGLYRVASSSFIGLAARDYSGRAAHDSWYRDLLRRNLGGAARTRRYGAREPHRLSDRAPSAVRRRGAGDRVARAFGASLSAGLARAGGWPGFVE